MVNITAGTIGVRDYEWDLGVLYDSITHFTARYEVKEDYGDKVLVKVLDILNLNTSGDAYRDVCKRMGIKKLGEDVVANKKYIKWSISDIKEPILDEVRLMRLIDNKEVMSDGIKIKLADGFTINKLMDLIIEKL